MDYKGVRGQMILQTDSRLSKEINVSGCYFMSLLYLANRETGYKLSIPIIERLYMQFIELDFMDENCYILDPEGILNYLGVKCKYTDRHESPKYRCTRAEIEILCLKYTGYKHFVVGDGFSHVTYNPTGKLKPGCYLHSKRIFKLL